MYTSNVKSTSPIRGTIFEKGVFIDGILLLSTFLTVLVGILLVYPAQGSEGFGFFLRQVVAAGVGFLGLLFFMFLPYQVFRTYVRPLYVGMLLVLVSVLFVGENLRGTKGWFAVGPIYIQASEIAKPLFVLTVAGYLDRRIKWFQVRSLAVPFLLALVPIGLILAQPDLSSSLVFGPVTLILFYVAGARTIHLLGICLVAGLAAGIPLLSTYLGLIEDSIRGNTVLMFLADAFQGGWPGLWLLLGFCLMLTFVWWFLRKMRVYIPSLYLWVTLLLIGLGTVGAIVSNKALKSYQRKRLVAFVNPELDPLGGGYNVRQSQIAIGSGRIIGKGYAKGTQSRLGFLPSRHTDFIFSVIGEEFGFLRSLMVLGLYFLIVWRGFEISLTAKDRFGSMVAAGFSAMFAFYAILNIGMTMGLAPVAGVPLPLLSYGGSSVVSSLIAVGILLSIHLRRYLL